MGVYQRTEMLIFPLKARAVFCLRLDSFREKSFEDFEILLCQSLLFENLPQTLQ